MKTKRVSLFELLCTNSVCVFGEWVKRTTIQYGLKVLMVCCCTLFVVSCNNEENEPKDIPDEYLLGIDYNNETDYKLSLFNARTASVCLMHLDEEGEIDRIDCRYGQEGEQFSITLNDKGLIESIGNDSLMFVFSNYEGNIMDAVILCQNEVFMLEDYECQVNWSDFLVAQKSKNRAHNRSIADNIEQWQRPLYNFSEKWGFLGGQAGDVMGLIHSAKTIGVTKKQVIESQVIRWLDVMGFFNTSITDYISMAAGVSEIMMSIASGNVWLSLYTVIMNYSSWVDFCENTVLLYLQMTEYIEAGLGMLNSGIGTLKATLTWNFYADVDLHAFEPDGDHIYFGNHIAYDSGGYLDVDNRAGGNGATENIYWEKTEDGTYEFVIDYFGPSTYNQMSQSGICQLNILYKGYGRTFSVPLTMYDTKSVTEIILPQGVYTRVSDSPNIKIRLNYKGSKKVSQCPVINNTVR